MRGLVFTSAFALLANEDKVHYANRLNRANNQLDTEAKENNSYKACVKVRKNASFCYRRSKNIIPCFSAWFLTVIVIANFLLCSLGSQRHFSSGYSLRG